MTTWVQQGSCALMYFYTEIVHTDFQKALHIQWLLPRWLSCWRGEVQIWMKAGMYADLDNILSLYEWEKTNFPGDEVFWEQVSRVTACGKCQFLKHGALFGGTFVALMDISVRCLPPRCAHQFHLDRNQDPRLCLYLLKHPTDPSWTFLQVPNLQHQEETRALLSTMAQPPHGWVPPSLSPTE